MAPGTVLAAVDDSKCAECHGDVHTSFIKDGHSKVLKEKGMITGKEIGCQKCHGDGTAHLASGVKADIISFGKDSKQDAKTKNAQCLTCHKTGKETAMWKMGKHVDNGVACSDCHNMHEGPLKTKPTSEKCLTCHKEVKLQTNSFSHHPIAEGKVSCNDCHNPHGTLNNKMLRAESVNSLCYKCHANKRGPFLWGHPPVEENCLNCHNPHGTRHASMLKERVPNLCVSCHTSTSNHTAPYDATDASAGFKNPATRDSHYSGRGCMNCHDKIHGSVAPDGHGFTR